MASLPINGLAVSEDTLSNSSLLNNDDLSFQVGDVQYLAVTSAPIVSVPCAEDPSRGPITYISALSPDTTGEQLQKAIEDSLVQDDVFTQDFLGTVLLSASISEDLDPSVISYLESLGSNIIYGKFEGPDTCGSSTLVPCPFFAMADGGSLWLNKALRLYSDTFSTFITGIYESNGSYKPLMLSDASGNPMIPVPSRLYSTEDDRPLAGQRIGVKDIYDLEGIQTTAGSRAYTAVNDVAGKTAPALQQIIDLGGVLVGKQKTAQFASPESPWDWSDFLYPRSPRGDTFLSCSGSSAGAGCSIAAYDWLDFAVGSDTGLSVRQPAAFAGVYGNRPSQGMILMDNIIINAFNTDTAGVFARDPEKWAAFAKAWYDPSLHQDPSVNGLPALSVPDERTFPKRILYPVDHLPLQNPAAEAILQQFLANASSALGTTVETFNLTATIEETASRPISQVLGDLFVLWTQDLIRETANPLLALYPDAFPAVDNPYRGAFRNLKVDDGLYASAVANRARDAQVWHDEVLFSTDESCSEAVFVYDVGTGGLPTFREQGLNSGAGATFPVNPTTAQAASISASYFGDADYTVPIGQVSYFSNVTFREEVMPVTVNLVAKRGCDFVLFNMVNELANQGVLGTVSTGKQAFVS